VVRAGAWPIKGIEPSRQTFEINGAQFHCHGYIAALDAWVMLGFDPRENPQLSRPNAKLSVRAEWAVKRTLFQAFCRKPLIWLDSYESSKRLLSSLAGDASAGPGFDYKVKGELASRRCWTALSPPPGLSRTSAWMCQRRRPDELCQGRSGPVLLRGPEHVLAAWKITCWINRRRS
jgi:hypothetical protein